MSASGSLEVGLASFTQKSTYMEPLPFERLYAQTLEEVELAESLGFDSMWMGEHHFSYEGQCPSVWPALARLAAATDRIKLGTSVLLLPFHTTERIAQACSAIEGISPGRLRLTMGNGYRRAETAAYGIDHTRRGRISEARIAELLSAEYAPAMGQTEIWLGGDARPVLRRAVRFGLPMLLNATLAQMKTYRERLAEEAEGLGLPTIPRLGVIREVWLEPNPRRAEWFRSRYIELWHHYAGIAYAEAAAESRPPDPALSVEKDGIMAGITTHDPRDLAAQAIIGGPDAVTEQLAPFVKEGFDPIVFHVRIGGMPTRLLRENLIALAEGVVPRLRALAVTAPV